MIAFVCETNITNVLVYMLTNMCSQHILVLICQVMFKPVSEIAHVRANLVGKLKHTKSTHLKRDAFVHLLLHV